MLIFTIVFNLLLSLLNCYIAWCLFKLTQKITHLRQRFEAIEHSRDRLISANVTQIIRTQNAMHQFNLAYQKRQQQFNQLRQILQILILMFGLRNSQFSRRR